MNFQLRIVCIAISGILALGGISSTFATPPKSNLEVIQQIFVKPTLEIVEAEVTAGQALCIQSSLQTEAANWLRLQLQEMAIKSGYRLLEGPGENCALVSLEQFLPKIEYSPLKKWFGLKTEAYLRNIEGELKLKLVKGNEVKLIRKLTPAFADTLSGADFRTVESEGYSFSHGTKLEKNSLKRLLEPGLITGATATVVYLFYSLRSN
ncbi:MAG: hypothetical protein Kow0037_08800 [Calditrichia bacterium]